MKVKEIVVGGIYSNGKTGKREVVAEGTALEMTGHGPWFTKSDNDYIKYKVLSGRKPDWGVNGVAGMTRRAMAVWAKERIHHEVKS